MDSKILFIFVVFGVVALATDWSSVGKSKMSHIAGANWDAYTSNPDAAMKQWINDHLYSIVSYTPYFDDKTSWEPSAFFYYDSYAIYTDSSDLGTLSQYILKDGNGNRMYIPWGCGGGTCPQYAADISSPGYRTWWVTQVLNALNRGSYKGVWIDDVNLQAIQVGNGNGNLAVPIDPNTGSAMTYDNWRRYFAEFMEYVRSQVPSKYEITHNSIWYAGPDGSRDQDQYVLRQIKSASRLNKEFGVIDGGFTGGSGSFSLRSFFSYVDRVHALGKYVVLEATINSDQDREYNLACYYLITNGYDTHDNVNNVTPDNWWSAYDLDLGSPIGDRYDWNGLIRRDFSNGIVLVNEPNAATVTATVGTGYTDTNSQSVSSVTLGGSSGAILYKPSSISTVAATVATVGTTTGSGVTTTGSGSTTGNSNTCTSNGLYKSKFAKRTGGDDDSYTSQATDDTKAWMNEHYYRIVTYTPYWDYRSTWYSSGWFYYDSYAIYDNSAQDSFYLKDGNGNKLYIPWGCGGGTCPQYAADISNSGYRQFWIDSVIGALGQGSYKGIWIDDVNLQGLMVSDGDGNLVAPIDVNTGAEMTFDDWRRYFAEFMEEVRAQVPAQYEIVHNSIWYGGPSDIRDADPFVQRQWAAATYLNKEGGVIDGGLTAGTAEWSLNALFAYVDRVHAAGKNVIFQGYISTNQERDYNFACYFLINNGYDMHDSSMASPSNWYGAYDSDLGEPLGSRYINGSLIRRDFSNAIVIVNEPYADTATAALDGTYTDFDGNVYTSVTLDGATGIILFREQPICAAITGNSPATCGTCAEGQHCENNVCVCEDGTQSCVSSASVLLSTACFAALLALLLI